MPEQLNTEYAEDGEYKRWKVVNVQSCVGRFCSWLLTLQSAGATVTVQRDHVPGIKPVAI